MNNEPNIEKWKSMPDLLEYLDMSRESVLEAITKRGMPAHRVGRLWKFKFPKWMNGYVPGKLQKK